MSALGRWARYLLAAAMVGVGVAHFTNPRPFVQHLPEWAPNRDPIVYATGLIEVAFGVALVALARHRRHVGRALALFFVAVFPANVYVAVADIDVDGLPSGIYPWIRLPFQVGFIAWALWSTNDGAARTPDP